jgi:hypothetical protein
MQKFEYRSPRFPVDLPVRLTVQNATVTGRCREISKEGMKLELAKPMAAGSRGTVSMSYQDQTLEVSVRVAHAGNMHGLKFLYESDKERLAVARLVSALAAPQNRLGPVLLS